MSPFDERKSNLPHWVARPRGAQRTVCTFFPISSPWDRENVTSVGRLGGAFSPRPGPSQLTFGSPEARPEQLGNTPGPPRPLKNPGWLCKPGQHVRVPVGVFYRGFFWYRPQSAFPPAPANDPNAGPGEQPQEGGLEQTRSRRVKPEKNQPLLYGWKRRVPPTPQKGVPPRIKPRGIRPAPPPSPHIPGLDPVKIRVKPVVCLPAPRAWRPPCPPFAPHPKPPGWAGRPLNPRANRDVPPPPHPSP